jgi:hypothetical protein
MAQDGMPDPHTLLTLQFLAWIADRPRRHAEVMEAWRSTCPRLSIWEDSVIGGLVGYRGSGDRTLSLTRRGRALLERQKEK